MRFDFGIIGGGILGLSIGRAILENDSSKKVLIIEKENSLGYHASSRNSGVLHAGFYYSPESLKAKFCREGNFELKQILRKHQIRILATGKVVVAKNAVEADRLNELLSRGVMNSVDLELLPEKDLIKFEPLARTYEKFLWSPTTSVSDPKLLISALQKEFQNMGGRIVMSSKVRLQISGGSIKIQDSEQDCKFIINAAGTGAVQLANSVGAGRNFLLLPFRGDYISASYAELRLRTLVYPVPSATNPFLGVHFTTAIDGSIKLGPTAVPLLGGEQYSGLRNLKLRESTSSLLGMVTMLSGERKEIIGIAFEELKKKQLAYLINEAAKLVPSVTSVKNWDRKNPGIRAQLVNKSSKQLESDSVIEKISNSLHILNAVSPGWTSAIPFGRHVAAQLD